MRSSTFGSIAAAQKRVGVYRGGWRTYESGFRTPRKKNRRRIERAFGKPWAELMTLVDFEAEKPQVSVLRARRVEEFGPLRKTAEVLGVSKSVLSDIERGCEPSEHVRRLLETTFGAPFEQLMTTTTEVGA